MSPKLRGKGFQIVLLNDQYRHWKRFLFNVPPFIALCHSTPDPHYDVSATRQTTPEAESGSKVQSVIDAACAKAIEQNITWLMPVSLELRRFSDKIPPVFWWY